MSATGSDGLWFWNRWLKSGYSDLGPITIPPRPQAIMLTDRNDGSQWLVWYNPGPPERLSIYNDPATIALLSRQEGLRIYSATDAGPIFTEDGRFLMILRGGRIGFDFEPYEQGVENASDAPLYARNGVNAIQINLVANPISVTNAHIGLVS
jgi:hypothetical protein